MAAAILNLDPNHLLQGSSPLHILANSNDTKSLTLLIHSLPDVGSFIDALDRQGRTPLVVALQNGRFGAARILVESGASFKECFELCDSFETVSQVLARPPYLQFLESLIEDRIDLQLDLSPALTLLMLPAAYEGRTSFLKALLEQYDINVDSIDEMGSSALHYASQRGEVGCVEILLRYGASTRLPNSQNMTPLHLACVSGHQDVVEIMFQEWVTPDPQALLNMQDFQGRTPLHLCLYCKQFSLFAYLVSTYLAYLDLKVSDSAGYTLPCLLFLCKFQMTDHRYVSLPILGSEEATWLLHEGVTQSNLDLVVVALAHGALVNCFDFMQQSPLTLASKLGSLGICRVLVESGADPNAFDVLGSTPLHHACKSGHSEVVQYLLSLCSLHPVMFYDRYNHPLSPNMVHTLANYFAKSESSKKPFNWYKWLALAAQYPNMHREAFQALVDELCPNDWCSQLAVRETCIQTQSFREFMAYQHSVLPSIVVLPVQEDGDLIAPPRNGKKKPRPFSLKKHFLAKVGFVFARRRENIPKTKWFQNKPKPFQFHFERFGYFPLHEAVIHRNTEVFSFILSKAIDCHCPNLVERLLIGVKDDSQQTVLELLGRNFQTFKNVLEELSLTEMVKKNLTGLYPLPESVSLIMAILHYLVSGGPQSVCHVTLPIKSKTPVDQWPQWYLHLILSEYCDELGHVADISSLSAEEGIRQLASQLVFTSGLLINESLVRNKYPCLLYTAVMNNCTWGVELLLHNGASPMAKFKERYAIVVAAERCRIEMLNLFLLNISQNQPNDDEIQSVSSALPSALVSLANSGFIDMVQKILDIFDTSSSLWSDYSNCGPRLLYVLLSLNAKHCPSFVVELVKEAALYILQTLLDEDQMLSIPLHFEIILPFLSRTEDSYIHQFVRFIKVCSNFRPHYMDLLFRYLCGAGEYDLVAFVLDTLSDAHIPHILCKLDSDNRSPLFYAACGGHSRVVELLVNRGSTIYSEEQDPPIKGLLMYFVLSPYTNCLGEDFVSSRVATRAARRKIYNRIKDCLPYCSFDSGLFSNQFSITRLVCLLLPAPDQLEHMLNKHFFQIFTMLSSVQNLNPFKEFLLGILNVAQMSTSLFNIPDDDEDKNNLSLFESIFNVHIHVLPHTKTPKVSLTDVAICLVPYSAPTSPEVTELHDSILVSSCADSHHPLLLETLSIAAEKGYWRLVMNALPKVIGDPCYPMMFLQKHLSIIWYHALLAEQIAVFDTFYAHILNKSILVMAAINHSKFHMLELFLNDPDTLYTALSASIRYNSMDTFISLLDQVRSIESHKLTLVLNTLVEQSVRYANTVSLNSLLALYHNQTFNIETEFPDKTLSFWFLVLYQSVKFGNEEFGLQSVSSISELQMKSIVNHDRYLYILNGCCYWGMVDLFQLLPVTSKQLFERPSPEVACPWENAAANGHLGKMSFLCVFPSLSKVIAQLPQDSFLKSTSFHKESQSPTSFVALVLFCGAFEKLLRLKNVLPDTDMVSKDTLCQQSFQCFSIDYVGILIYAITEGLTKVVQVFLDHLGKYAGDVVDILEVRSEGKLTSMIFTACCKHAKKDNVAVLELLLKALANSNQQINHLKKKAHGSSKSLFEECLSATVHKGSVKCTEVLLRCVFESPDQLSVNFKQRFQNGNTLLHLAVYSKSPEMVDIILGLLKEDAPDSCFLTNQYDQYPLYMAFALGCTNVIQNSSLMKKSWKSVKFYELEKSWYPDAFVARGWFHSMMLSNSANNSDGSHTNIESSAYAHTPGHAEVDIRTSNNIWKLLYSAVKYQEHTLVKTLLLATPCEWLFKSNQPPVDLLESIEVLQLIKERAIDSKHLAPALIEVVVSLNKVMNNEDVLMQALDLIQYDDHHASFIKETFYSACALHKMKVVKHLLQRSCEVVVIQVALFQDKDTLKHGLAQAITLGYYDIAAYLQLEYEIPYEKRQFPECVNLTHQIFSYRTYYQLLESFFESTSKSVSANASRCFPLAAAWLAHYWTEEEAMLIMKRVGGKSGTNPWKVNVTSNPSGPTELLLHVDWDSFSECLLRSPHVDSLTSKYRYTPLLAEATVFSPIILGEILQCFQHSQSSPFLSRVTSFDLFSLAVDSSLSSMILSCDTWPAKPSFVSMNSGEQGVLSLSYKPNKGVFIFPDTTVAMFNTSDLSSVASGIDDSGIHFSFEKVSYVNDLHIDIARYYRLQIRRIFLNKVKACIKFDQNLLDSALFNSAHSCVQLCLDDCISALKLIQKPAVRYSHAITQLHSIGIGEVVLSGVRFEPPFRRIVIILNLMEHQSVQVTCDRDVLNISINLVSDSDTQDIRYPSFESLLESITTGILSMEIEKDKEDFMKAVVSNVLPKLKQSLKFGGCLDHDLLSLAVRDNSGNFHKIGVLTAEHLIHIKSLTKLKHFLSLFFKMLHVVSFKPKVQTSIRNQFEAGFKIFLTSSDGVSYSVKAGVPQLTISCQMLMNGSYQQSLLDILRSLVKSALYQRQNITLKDFASHIPAASLCYIDTEKSKGFLYPMVETKGTVLIQLVDYNNQKLSTRPTINCVVEITVIHPTQQKVHLTYKDDECAVASSHDKQVIVHFTSSGEIQIEWTPKEAGLYCVFITLNSVPIKRSPFKSWCIEKDHTKNLGTRKSIAGFPLTFVVEHNHLKPQCNYYCVGEPLVHLHKRAPIKPLCIAALDPFDEDDSIRNMSATKADSESTIIHGSPSKALKDKLMQAESISGIHHISLSSNFKRSEKLFGLSNTSWFQIPVKNVTIHISPDDDLPSQSAHFNVQCNPLNNGMSNIILKCTKAHTFKMFVSCPICQSVMKIHWVDQMALLPSICYVLPGKISPIQSTLKYTSPYVQGRYDFGEFTVVAGSSVSFTITACDEYGNAHTSGGAIKTISIKGAGQRNLRENMTWSELTRAVSRPVSDEQCKVIDCGNGTYTASGEVYITGIHSILVTDKYSPKSFLLNKQLRVTSQPAFAPYCHFSTPNGIEAFVSQMFICTLDLYDQYMNPCTSATAHSQVQTTVGGFILCSISGAQAVKRRLSPRLTPKDNTVVLYFVPESSLSGQQELNIHVNGVLHPSCPMIVNVVRMTESFSVKYTKLKSSLRAVYCIGYTPTLTINRSDILENSLRIFSTNRSYFKKIIRIRFGEETGIDAGGVSNEFFHLLCLEFVNPQYALFQCVNGLYKPSPNSSVNTNHLIYFEFFGKMLAKAICDGHQVTVRFTPAVYKYLIGRDCSLDDLKIEDPSMHKGLFEIMDSKSDDVLEQLADNFTTVKSHFGALHTVELEQGGEKRKVTMTNRHDFVQKLFTWHLTGCIQQQLSDLKRGFNSLISTNDMESFSAHELEVILSGQPTIDIEFIKGRTVYEGYSSKSQEMVWLWEVLTSFTQELRCQFLQFTTGCACLPTADMGQWRLTVKRGASDSSLLPQAATCFNSITLPVYPSKNTLKSKLELAISYGQQAFLNY